MPRRPDLTPAERAGRAFLAASVVGALNTANAREPLKRTGRAGLLAFFPGWLTSEAPLHTIFWQVLATLGFARRGAFRSWRGLVGLVVSLGSWTVLTQIWQQSKQAGEVFDAALREGLGDELDAGSSPLSAEDDVQAVAQRLPAEPMVLSSRRLVSGPVSLRHRRFQTNRAISYGGAGRRNQLDVWKRPDLPMDAKAPVLVQVHGGGWVIGNKDQQALPLLTHMAESGWVCVAINYRLSPRATWPDHIVDVKRALAWVKANIADYGGDPDFVCITGGSAGGHLSSLAALSPNEPEFQPGFEAADTSVRAAVPFYGVYDMINRDGTGRGDMEGMLAKVVFKSKRRDAPSVWEQASTMSWVGPHAPPFFVIHGANDTLVPVEQARSFVAMLRAESKHPVAYAELPGTQHAFEVFDSPRTIFSTGAVHRFLEAVRVREGHTTDV